MTAEDTLIRKVDELIAAVRSQGVQESQASTLLGELKAISTINADELKGLRVSVHGLRNDMQQFVGLPNRVDHLEAWKALLPDFQALVTSVANCESRIDQHEVKFVDITQGMKSDARSNASWLEGRKAGWGWVVAAATLLIALLPLVEWIEAHWFLP